jgi:hypothetical protein
MMNGQAIEVIYALASRQVRVVVTVPTGGTVAEAIRRSGLLSLQPEIDLSRNKLGIFGRIVSTDTPVRDGDRIEIYRPLAAEPKEARRLRAGAAKWKN